MGETIVNENGTITYTVDKTKLSLTKMQYMVGGYIQLVHDDGETQIVCNEDGKLDGRPENEEATDLWHDLNEDAWGDYLVGDVLILKGKARMD